METEKSGGKLVLWHASRERRAALLPFTHLGTLSAALQRAGETGAGHMHRVELSVGRSLEIRDMPQNQHHVAGLVEWLESNLVHPEDHPDEGSSILSFSQVNDLLTACRTDAAPSSLAGGAAVAATLRGLGYDSLHYVNAWEDVGSRSWVVLDPAAARVVGIMPVAEAKGQAGPVDPEDERAVPSPGRR